MSDSIMIHAALFISNGGLLSLITVNFIITLYCNSLFLIISICMP